MSDIKLFLSWAHYDAEMKDSFLTLLRQRLDVARNHSFTWWVDSFILPGEEWKEEILKQLDNADYIVQLISPSFLASDFIRKYEIPGVPLDGTVEFHQIDRRQIYCGNSYEPHSYVSRETDYQRNQFVDGFFSRIIDRVEGKGGYR